MFKDQNRQKKLPVVLESGIVVDPVIFYTQFNKDNMIKSIVKSDKKEYDYKCGHVYYLKDWIKPITDNKEFNITPMAEQEIKPTKTINRTDLKRFLLKYLGILEFNQTSTEHVINKIRKELCYE
jgi:hypothetical protein